MPSELPSSSAGKPPNTKIIQVSNISPIASREQIYQLFSYLGKIDEIRVYPQETNPMYSSMTQKLAYVKYEDSSSVATAQHITNTVFIDRALICVPVFDGKIPDEDTALKTGGPSWPGQRQLPPNVLNQIQCAGEQQVVMTIDPTLAALGLPAYPSLPANTDATKIEEIRRTIYVGNIPKNVEPEETMQFFNEMIGEVMYLRMAGGENMSNRYAYIEFSNQHSVPTALQNDGLEFKGNKLLIQHSRVAIIKPQAKTQDMAKREIQEALKKQQTVGLGMPGSMTTSALNRGLEADMARRIASRSRSRSPGFWGNRFRRSRSRSADKRARSRSKGRFGSSRRHGRRDRSRDRRSRSRDRRARSRDRKKRSKSRDKDRESKRKRSRSTSKSRKDKDKDKDEKRQRDRDDKRRSDRDKEKVRKSEKEKKRSETSSSSATKTAAEKAASDRQESETGKVSVKKEPIEETEEEKQRKEQELREVDEILEEALGRKEIKQEPPSDYAQPTPPAESTPTPAVNAEVQVKREPPEEEEEDEKTPATEILSAREKEAFKAWKNSRRKNRSSVSSEEEDKARERKRKKSRSRSPRRNRRSRSRSEARLKRRRERDRETGASKRKRRRESSEEDSKKAKTKDRKKKRKEKDSKHKKKTGRKETSDSSSSSSGSDSTE